MVTFETTCNMVPWWNAWSQKHNMIIHLWAYEIICVFLYLYLLAKTEIFYMLNSFILLAKRNNFFILKDQFSPVFTFIIDICLLLTKNNYKITFCTVLAGLEL